MSTLAAVPDAPDIAATPEVSLDDLEALTDDELTDEVITWAGRVAAGEARLLAALGEFDSREQWAKLGMPSCAQWLSWRLGMGLKTAYERVRIARALRELPMIRSKFERGELSYSQVRALSRTARPDSEAELLQVARCCSGEQIERLTRGMRRAKRLNDLDDLGQPVPPPEFGLQVDNMHDGSVEIKIRLPIEQSTVIVAAIDTVRDQLEADAKQAAKQAATQRKSSFTPAAASAGSGHSSAEDSLDPLAYQPAERQPRPRVSRLESFMHLVRDWMSLQSSDVRRRLAPRLTAQIDPHSGWGRLPNGEFLPPEVVRRLDVNQFDRGRTRREADAALRHLLGVIDGERCRYPGCHHTRYLHAHHVIWWKRGDRTDLDNLILLCSKHHTFVHDRDIRMTLDPGRALSVEMPDGTALPHRPDVPYRPATELDPQGLIGPQLAPTPEAVDQLSLEYAVSVLVHLAA